MLVRHDDNEVTNRSQRAFQPGVCSGTVRPRGRVVPFRARAGGHTMLTTAEEVLARYAEAIRAAIAQNLPLPASARRQAAGGTPPPPPDAHALERQVTQLAADVTHEVRVGWLMPCPDGAAVWAWLETRLAWVLLARVYRARIERVIARLLPVDLAADVDDCASTAEILAYRFWSRCRLDRPGARGAWIRRIAVNVAYGWIRDPRNRPRGGGGGSGPAGDGGEPDATPDWADPAAIPLDEVTATREELEALATEFARLSPEQQQAIYLVTILGYTCEEAARELGLPSGTVKSRTSRGRQLLKRWRTPRAAPPEVPPADEEIPHDP